VLVVKNLNVLSKLLRQPPENKELVGVEGDQSWSQGAFEEEDVETLPLLVVG